MKCLFVLVAMVAFAAMAKGQSFPTAKCPKGEHSVLYCPQKAEPDCNIREVHALTTGIAVCDRPQCFCNQPTIRNLKTGMCVMPDQC